jgi:acetyltransferase
VYLRYFHMIGLDQRVAHERLARVCFVGEGETVLVAEREPQIVAVGRMVRSPREKEAEVAILVSDGFHKLGLGTELVRRLVEFARLEHLDRVVAEILPENTAMQRVFRRAGFELQYSMREGLKAILVLAP